MSIQWLKRTPPSVTPPAGEAGRRRATLRLRRLATPLCLELALGKVAWPWRVSGRAGLEQ
jgi:hypothetical protein